MIGLRQFFIYTSAVLFVVFTVSCAEESTPAEGQDEEVIEVGSEEVVIEDQVHHQVPSPHEMMEFIVRRMPILNLSCFVQQKFIRNTSI